ncbi:hypothetical protein E3T40_01705 [Cryobacterium sp. TMT1-19]|nr:hypothetical protein E3T40_01705 [Cryobacterium sp. TMT1-19]
MRPDLRRLLLPAAPLIGAAYLVVALHLTGIFLPAGVGVWIAAAVALVALVIRFILDRSAFIDWFSALPGCLGVAAVGGLGAMVALTPSLLARSPLAMQATQSNDAFYYVSVSQWVAGNAITTRPSLGTSPLTGVDSPVFGPAYESMNLSLRVGQELAQAGLSALTDIPIISGFSPWLGLWVFLIPGGAWVLGAAFGLPRRGRLALGALLVVSFSVQGQVLQQNADSLLGVSVLPLVIGLVVMAVRPNPDHPRVPLWLPALVLAALVGTYTEYIPLLGMTLAVLVIVGPVSGLRAAVLRAAGLVGLSIAFGPLIWWRAVQGLLFLGTVAAGGNGVGVGPRQLAKQISLPVEVYFNVTWPSPSGLVVTVLIVFALLCACALAATLFSSRTRAFGIGGVGLSTLVVLYIGSRGNEYITRRAVDMLMPLLIIGAVLGASVIVAALRARLRGDHASRALTLGVTAIAIAGALAPTYLVVRLIVQEQADDRIVSPAVGEAADWVSDRGGDGDDVTAALTTLYDQLWLSEALVDEPDVSYVNMRGDLGYRGNLNLLSYWDGELDRFILVGPGAYLVAEDAAVAERNELFQMLDLSHGPVTVAVPVELDPSTDPTTRGRWAWTIDVDGRISGDPGTAVELLSNASDLSGEYLLVEGVGAGATLTLRQGASLLHSVKSTGATIRVPLADVSLADGKGRVLLDLVGQTTPLILKGITSE